MTKEELRKKLTRPCPFCGSADLYITTALDSEQELVPEIFCNHCKMGMTVEDSTSTGLDFREDQSKLCESLLEVWENRAYTASEVKKAELRGKIQILKGLAWILAETPFELVDLESGDSKTEHIDVAKHITELEEQLKDLEEEKNG